MSVRLGPRDFEAVQWLSEMKGAPLHVVAQLLGCSDKSAYRVVARWVAAGMVIDERLRPVPGPTWVVPTAAVASSMLGFTVSRWIPGPKDARHNEMCGRVRLAVSGGQRLDTWRSERVLWRDIVGRTEAGKQRPHLHDGQYIDRDGNLVAVEIELTRKGSADARVTMQAAYDAARDAGAVSLRYFCDSPEVRSRVAAAVQDLTKSPGGPEVASRDLNKFLNPEAGHGRGLSVVGGTAS